MVATGEFNTVTEGKAQSKGITIGEDVEETSKTEDVKEALNIEDVLEAQNADETEKALIAKDAKEAPIVEDANEAPIVVEDTNEAPIVVEDAKEALIVVEDAKEAPVVVEDIEEAPVVVEDIEEAPIVVEDIEEAPIVVEDTKEAPVVVEDIKESPSLENAKTAPAYAKEAPNVNREDAADAEKESIGTENLTETTDGKFALKNGKCEDSKEITGADVAEVEEDVTNVSSMSGGKFSETETSKRKADSSGDTKQVISEKIAKLDVTV